MTDNQEEFILDAIIESYIPKGKVTTKNYVSDGNFHFYKGKEDIRPYYCTDSFGEMITYLEGYGGRVSHSE